MYGNASVYALKTWHRVLDGAKAELFQAMCRRSVNWPRVFWETYRTDGAEPSASLTNLINDSLRGRMRVDAFEEEYLRGQGSDVSGEELRLLITETISRANDILPADEVRCGDLYARGRQRYWLNLRPDCDCIPRDCGKVADLDVHCVEGKRIAPSELHRHLKNGHYVEDVSESVVFGVIEGKSVLFRFNKLHVCKYSEVSGQRVGAVAAPARHESATTLCHVHAKAGVAPYPGGRAAPHSPKPRCRQISPTQPHRTLTSLLSAAHSGITNGNHSDCIRGGREAVVGAGARVTVSPLPEALDHRGPLHRDGNASISHYRRCQTMSI